MTDLDPVPGRDHIVIVGASKTGTTGLYSLVRNSLGRAGHDYAAVFEPARAERLDSLFRSDPGRPVLTKTTADRVQRIVPDPYVFERRLATVRDPRDTLISSVLFRPVTRSALQRTDETGVRRFIDLVERKEADPSSVSVRELFELSDEIGIGAPPYPGMLRDYRRVRRLIRRYGFHQVRYEEFVAGDHGGISKYLGLDVAIEPSPTSAMYGHIGRSKESGAFRNWFRPDDLAYYGEMFGEFIDAFGYPREVDLPDDPALDPATGSEYLTERTRTRRQALHDRSASRAAAASKPVAMSSDDIPDVVDHAANGSAADCVRLAEAYQRGDFGTPDLNEALAWSRRAAHLGLARGVAKTVELIEALEPGDPALRRELRGWKLSQAEAARVEDLRTALDRERRSTRWRVGSLVVAAANSPRTKTVPAVRGLAGMWLARRRRKRADTSDPA